MVPARVSSISLVPIPEALLKVRSALSTVIEGKGEVLDLVLVAVLARGHVLLEDVPGVGKTTLAKAIARVFAVDFARVQFTPDLLPSDILGTQVLRPADGTFELRRGPIFTSVLLADEINRASPRTQSALLEAMNEAQATIDGVSHPLPSPFFVVATQNPADFSGTYPLPEAQLDRFLLRTTIGYPSAEAELRILFARATADPLSRLEPMMARDELLALQRQVQGVIVKEDVAKYVLRIIEATRTSAEIEIGGSPRASLALFRACQARALLEGRDYVSPADVQALAASVLAHRLRLTPSARLGGRSDASVIGELVGRVAVPV
ncbi:MAG: MoxR family ATPase [Myxococcales bacterium]|nr:MoxR family ATPase [Myxococcales bacterium]